MNCAEGDRVVVRWAVAGTQTGAFQSFLATGNSIVRIVCATGRQFTSGSVKSNADWIDSAISFAASRMVPVAGDRVSTS